MLEDILFLFCIHRYQITNCEILWAIKDESIVSTFVDAGAAKFFLAHLSVDKTPDEGPSKRIKYSLDGRFA